MRKRHSTANILLIELVLVILFFMLCVSTIVEMFGLARVKSAYAKASCSAMLAVENLEERLAGAENAGAELEAAGFTAADGRWVLEQDGYTITAAETEEKTEAGILRTVEFSAEQKTGRKLFDLPVVNYLPGEVSP